MNPNKVSNQLYGWKDVLREINDMTPKEDNFIDVYGKKVVDADKERVRGILAGTNAEDNFGIYGADIQEYITSQEIGEMDWFHEEDRREEILDDDRAQDIAVFLTSKYDDTINHVDMVCIIKNACTDYEAVPFFMDATFNTDDKKLDKKMSWRHPKEEVKHSGFATVKYFEDDFNMDAILDKGRIEIAPRFVIGYDAELANTIMELRNTRDGGTSEKRERASAMAKWCVLKELNTQCRQMLDYLEKADKNSVLLQKAYEQVKALSKYFSGAMEAAKKHDAKFIPGYPNTDPVCEAICERSIV